jgi:hypothetical protein
VSSGGRGPTHYEVLGVGRTASTAEIRRAYLTLARRHHPDLQPDGSPELGRAEEEMRRLNVAWATIGDPERRRRYDAELDGAARRAVVDDPPTRTWRPLDDDWTVDEPDDPRLDDSAYAPPPGGRSLVVGPSLLVVVGVAAGAVGLVTGLRVAIAVAVIAFALAAVVFVAAPVAAIFDSRRRDRI